MNNGINMLKSLAAGRKDQSLMLQLLSAYYIQSISLGVGEVAVNMTKSLPLENSYSSGKDNTLNIKLMVNAVKK